MLAELLVLSLAFLGLLFKFLNWPGGNSLMIIGLSTATMVNMALGFLLYRIRDPQDKSGYQQIIWLSIIAGFFLGPAYSAILFKMMHWPGSAVMLSTAMFSGLVLLVLSGVLFFIKPEKRGYLRNMLIRCFVLTAIPMVLLTISSNNLVKMMTGKDLVLIEADLQKVEMEVADLEEEINRIDYQFFEEITDSGPIFYYEDIQMNTGRMREELNQAIYILGQIGQRDPVVGDFQRPMDREMSYQYMMGSGKEHMNGGRGDGEAMLIKDKMLEYALWYSEVTSTAFPDQEFSFSFDPFFESGSGLPWEREQFQWRWNIEMILYLQEIKAQMLLSEKELKQAFLDGAIEFRDQNPE